MTINREKTDSRLAVLAGYARQDVLRCRERRLVPTTRSFGLTDCGAQRHTADRWGPC
jgi:hypothetical protein